jgi:hypothetical protein
MPSNTHRLGWVLAILLGTAGPLGAQIAQSRNIVLTDLSLDAVGDGMSSLGVTARLSVGGPSSEPMSSAQFSALIGFLGGDAPDVTDVPVVYGLQPAFGPIAGGTPLVIGGVNFDKFGTAASLSVTIDGVPLDGLVVQSDSQITGTAPAGLNGPHDVVVSSSLGATTQPDAYIHTPALITTQNAMLKSRLDIRNYGATGDQYMTLASLTSWSAPTKYGTLLVGPVFITLLPPMPYPGPLGIATVSVKIPNSPVLHGLTVHFQSLSITQPTPLLGSLTNASATFIP